MTKTRTTPQTKTFDVDEAGFEMFVVVWNQKLKQNTPDLHLKMARWLEWNWEQKNNRLLLMAFRSAGKSTIVGLFAAWLLYRDPNLRILVLAADFNLAKKMVRNVKRVIERHPLTTRLRPDNPDQWASDRFTIKRMLELRDPSMLAKGITSNITGSRADIVICDDVEVPNTCDSVEKREELRTRLGEMNYVLVPGGTQLYVGTPHHYNTIYAQKPRTELGEETAFLQDFERLKIPILDESGESAWIERYGDADITRMQETAGPNKFASQMMLEPRNVLNGRLNPDLLRIYDDALDYVKELNGLYLSPPSLEGGGRGEGAQTLNDRAKHPYRGGKCTKLVSASAFWDPAFGSAKGDHSVLAIIYADADGNYYVHHVEYIQTSGADETDIATQQCRIVADLVKAHYLPSLGVETNGLGKFLPGTLRNELARAKAPCRLLEIHQTQNKTDRILEAFDALLAARRLYVHRDVLKTPFMTEMQEWRPGSSRGHDDGIDAVAGALALEPDRLPRIYGRGGHSWMRSGKPAHKADTDFRV